MQAYAAEIHHMLLSEAAVEQTPIVPVIVVPGEIFCGIVTLHIISLPGFTRAFAGTHAADRFP